MVFFQKIDLFLIYFFFLSKKNQKETFFDVLDRKECFLDRKRKVLKNSKESTFCNLGLVHGFCQKIDLFLICFFWAKKSQKETFFDVLDRKECFLDRKKKVLKNSKESTFYKGVSSWFLSKNWPFSYKFFFEQKAIKKHFLIFWIQNKVFWTSKMKFSQSRKKKTTLCKGVSPWFLSKNRLFSHMFFFWAKKSRKKHFLIFFIEKNAF